MKKEDLLFKDILLTKLGDLFLADAVIDFVDDIFPKIFKDYDTNDIHDISILNNKVNLIAAKYSNYQSRETNTLSVRDQEFIRLVLSTKH